MGVSVDIPLTHTVDIPFPLCDEHPEDRALEVTFVESKDVDEEREKGRGGDLCGDRVPGERGEDCVGMGEGKPRRWDVT